MGYVSEHSSQRRRSWSTRQRVAFDGGVTRAHGGYGECGRGHWRWNLAAFDGGIIGIRTRACPLTEAELGHAFKLDPRLRRHQGARSVAWPSVLESVLAATAPVVSIVVVGVDVGVVGVMLDVGGRWSFVGGTVRIKRHIVCHFRACAIGCGGRGRRQRRWAHASERGLWDRLTLQAWA